MSGQFDRKLFAELLELAKGEKRSMNQYAQRCGVTVSHISRLLRGMIETPPNPQTIRKFADVAFNGVTYEQLMQAAGHIQDGEETPQAPPQEIDEGMSELMWAKKNLTKNQYYELVKGLKRLRIAIELEDE